MEVHREGDYQVLKIGPLGPYDNNAYIISDTSAKQSLIVDMPAESQQVVDALGELRVDRIIATHWHGDHWADYDLVRAATGAPVYIHEGEIKVPPERIDGRLRDGEEIQVGGVRVRILHTPGHTPGSISLRVGRVLISGDTLFNGGPGRTAAAEDLQTELRSIADQLLGLPQETIVWPGHGVGTTIAASIEGFNAFKSRSHAPDLHGDVTWTES
jgi:glyoxylase-like metal-dependent hydrolase (beta-lactamase superfamily II)